MFARYYRLTKPGMVYANAFTALAGFLYASRWNFSLLEIFALLIGISLVVASACVFNNYIDREIDAKMERTKNRALVTGWISVRAALVFGATLGIIGFTFLWALANPLAAGIALFGWLWYVIAYSWGKRASHWGVVVGSVAGAVPIVVGYTAALGHLDSAAGILFLALALWQMPHFYAIAIRREDEYASAGIPVLPLARGGLRAKSEMVAYIVAFMFVAASLAFVGAGGIYLIVTLVLAAAWLTVALGGFATHDTTRWARGVFFASLFVLMLWSTALAFAPLLP